MVLRQRRERAVRVGVALRETENLSTVEWAAGALRTLAARLRPRPGEPTPVPRLLRLAGDEIELVWDTPNVAHDNPVDQQFCASLILGFADAAARTAFFAGDEIAGLSDALAPFASAIHAYDVSAALTYVKDGTILPQYQL